MDPAIIQVVTQLLVQTKVCAPSMARTGSAQRMDASPTQHQGKGCAESILLIKRLAQLKAAALSLLYEGFACSMVLTGSAQLMGAIQLFSLGVSARNMVLMASALSTPAIQPPSIKKETATGIAITAARQCAR